MADLYLKPARLGDIIRDPINGRILPPEGGAKPRNPHWLRRLGRGEVVETEAEAVAEGKKTREAAESEAAARITPETELTHPAANAGAVKE